MIYSLAEKMLVNVLRSVESTKLARRLHLVAAKPAMDAKKFIFNLFLRVSASPRLRGE